MARNSRRSRRAGSTNRPPAVARQPRPRPGSSVTASGAPSAGSARAIAESEDLGASYVHVRRDLMRIMVFGVLLFAAIFGSQLI